MAMLTGPQIVREIFKKSIIIQPFDVGQVNPNSVNLRLGPKLLVYRTSYSELRYDESTRTFVDDVYLATVPIILDVAKDNPTDEITIPVEGIVLQPGKLYLGSTLEYTETHGFVPMIEGRSSVGRLGLSVHVTAGFGDIGFKGDWTLELHVIHPLRIYAGMNICQISYETVLGDLQPYNGKYQGQRGPKASRLWKEFQAEE